MKYKWILVLLFNYFQINFIPLNSVVHKEGYSLPLTYDHFDKQNNLKTTKIIIKIKELENPVYSPANKGSGEKIKIVSNRIVKEILEIKIFWRSEKDIALKIL